MVTRSIGSSPRARGTQISRSSQFVESVHPRGRGEHISIAIKIRYANGSSPRARGTHSSQSIRDRRKRFIPAGAGNTTPIMVGASIFTVHPRGRGEHEMLGVMLGGDAGSSPRARGTHLSNYLDAKEGRFIPAGAGNTANSGPPSPFFTVHPRGRGEHFHHLPIITCVSGSSPRARGTPQIYTSQ